MLDRQSLESLLETLEAYPSAFSWHEKQQIKAARDAFDSHDHIDQQEQDELQALTERLL